MRYREVIHLVMLHIALICGLVILTVSIVDWYNPYMNFSGQIQPLEILQVCDLVLLVLIQGIRNKRGGR